MQSHVHQHLQNCIRYICVLVGPAYQIGSSHLRSILHEMQGRQKPPHFNPTWNLFKPQALIVAWFLSCWDLYLWFSFSMICRFWCLYCCLHRHRQAPKIPVKQQLSCVCLTKQNHKIQIPYTCISTIYCDFSLSLSKLQITTYVWFIICLRCVKQHQPMPLTCLVSICASRVMSLRSPVSTQTFKNPATKWPILVLGDSLL